MLCVCDLNLAKKGSATDEPEINVPTHAFFFPWCLLQCLSTKALFPYDLEQPRSTTTQCHDKHVLGPIFGPKLSRANIANTGCVCIRLGCKGPVKTTSIVPGSDG